MKMRLLSQPWFLRTVDGILKPKLVLWVEMRPSSMSQTSLPTSHVFLMLFLILWTFTFVLNIKRM